MVDIDSVGYNDNGKVTSLFGIDIYKVFEKIEQNIRDIDDNVIEAINKLHNKIGEIIPDKLDDGNDKDAINH
jgi:hypothetical protein